MSFRYSSLTQMWRFLILFLVPMCCAELLQVFVLWRHGDRAPSRLPYPNDPYNESFWPRGWDQLTEEGMRQTFTLGKWLKNRYIVEQDFLSSNFNRHEILIRSSNIERAIESAQSVAAGLYPAPISWESSSNLVGRQPIPIWTSPYGEDDPLLKPTSVKCQLAKDRVKSTTKGLEDSINSRYKSLFIRLANYTGMSSVSFKNVKTLDGIRLEMIHGLKQPDWVYEKWNGTPIIKHITTLKQIVRLSSFDSREKSEYRAGVFLDDVAGHLETSRSSSQRKAYFYSSHDGTINSVMYTLGIGNNLLVPYAAAFIIEHHKKDGQHLVKFLYKNETDNFFVFQLPNCTELCPLNNFLGSIAERRISSVTRLKELCSNVSSTRPHLLLLVFLKIIIFE